MSYPFLVAVAPGACIADPAEFVALVEGSSTPATVGLIYVSASAPDVITYPDLKKWVWIDSSTSPLVLRFWNQATLTWDTQVPRNGSINTDMLADGAATLAKLSVLGGTAGYVMRINPGGTAVIFDDPQNLYSTTNRLSVNKLSLSTAGNFVLQSNGVSNQFVTFGSLFANETVTLDQIDVSAAATQKVLGYLGTTFGWYTIAQLLVDRSIALNKLVPAAANYLLRMKADGSDWEAVPFSSLLQTVDSGEQSLPTAAGTPVTFTHNLNSTALSIEFQAICKVANNGWSIGDILPFSAFTLDDTPGGPATVSGAPAFYHNLKTNSLDVYIAAHAGATFKVIDRTSATNLAATTTRTDWRWRALITKLA